MKGVIVHRLSNGFTVAVDSMAHAQSVAIGLYASVGSRLEPEGLGGLAHIVEHLVFKGAGRRNARQIAEAIEDVGGSLNAWTSRDQTVFSARVLPDHAALAIELVADLLRSPRLDRGELELEKGVILSELGECRDSPDDHVHDLLYEAAFDSQPYGRPVIGTEASIAAVSRQDCVNWIASQFLPERLTLVASGKVDPSLMIALAERLFGDMPASNSSMPVAPRFSGGHRHDGRRFEQAHWAFAMPGLAAADPRVPALSIFTQAVGGGMSSRLFQQLREDRGLAYSIDAWHGSALDVGLFTVSCAADRSKAAETVGLARAIIEQACVDLTEAEVRRARAQLEAGMLMGLETPSGRADHIARSLDVFGRVLDVDEITAKLRAVAPAEARAAGAALHDGPHAIAAVGGPLAVAA